MNPGLSIGGLFLEGLLSFFSPCVLPLIPLYIGYLTKGTAKTDEEGNTIYDRGKTFLITIAFVLGVSMVFVIAGFGSGLLHSFFLENTILFQLTGGFVLLVFGLFALHVIDIPVLQRTYRKQLNPSGRTGFVQAWLMGFLFSFAWSPCIGPMLAQAIVLAATAADSRTGWMYIASYAAGFLVLFLVLGLFTAEVLNFLKKYRNAVKYTEILAGLLVLCTGLWMLFTGFRSVYALEHNQASASETAGEADENAPDIEQMNFTLPDKDGVMHSLTDYRGKTIIVNFFGTWCYYCNEELPGLQKIQDTRDDVAILLIAAPNAGSEGDVEYIENYMQEAGYSMTILYDANLSATRMYGISGYPTSFFLRPDGSFLGYVPGYVPDDQLMNILDQALLPAEE